MKKFNRLVCQTNPDGTFLSQLEHKGHNMPSIADYQLMFEFLDYRYLSRGELSVDWRSLYPRLVKWHDAMLSSHNHHLSGFTTVLAEWEAAMPAMLKKQYSDDKLSKM